MLFCWIETNEIAFRMAISVLLNIVRSFDVYDKAPWWGDSQRRGLG
jgi:hypothetical protein